jgi:hypothetical protein
MVVVKRVHYVKYGHCHIVIAYRFRPELQKTVHDAKYTGYLAKFL